MGTTFDSQQRTRTAFVAMPATRALAEFAATWRLEDVPVSVRDRIRTDALDSVAVGVFGHTQPPVQTAVELWREQGGAEQSSVWGRGFKLPTPKAVQANSHAVNAFEYDDTYVWGGFGTHQGNNVNPAALAVAELVGHVSGRELLTAMVVGHEVSVRVMYAITKKRPGWNHTALVSTFGAAAASGRLLGLDGRQMTWALGSAGVYVGGLLTMPPESNVKQMVNGRMAEGGTIAALLAARNFTGVENVLEATQGGFYSNHADGVDYDRLLGRLGDVFYCENVHTKRFPMCTSVHAPLEAACEVAADQGLDVDAIDHVVVHTTSGAQSNTVGFEPTNLSSIQMSLAYGVATALGTGNVLPRDITEDKLGNVEFRSLMNKVKPFKDPELDEMWKGRSGSAGPARVVVYFRDGTSKASSLIGEASRMTNGEIEAKAQDAMGSVIGNERSDAIVRFFADLEAQASTADLLKQL